MLPHFAAVCKRGGQILRRFPVLTCHFGSVMLYSVQRFAWKEGTPGWAGTAAFSLKKATPKHFRLEVYPFFFRQSVEHRFYAPRSFAVGRFCFAGKWGTVSRRSRKGVPHESYHPFKKAAALHLSVQFLFRPAHHGCRVGGAAGRPRVLAVGDRPCRERLPYRQPVVRGAQRNGRRPAGA